MGFVGRFQSIMNGAGNVIPPSVDGNIHPEASARNLGTYYRSYHPELLLGSPKPNSNPSVPTSARAASSNGSSGGSGSASEPQSPATFDYLDAPWASAYGLSKETAYLEAMENTGYQRSVADMKRAGLNPAVIFGSGGGYSAGAPAFVSSGSGSGSGSGSRRSSGRKPSGKLFSGSAYSVLSALGGIVGAAATKTAGGYWLGTSLTQGAMSALSLLTGHKG